MRKARNVAKRFASFALALLVIVTTVFGNVDMVAWANEVVTPEVVAAFEYGEMPQEPAGSDDFGEGAIAAATTGMGMLFTDSTVVGFSTGSISATPWSEGNAWTVAFNATNYNHLTIEGKMRASNKGPKNWKVSYSTDGGATWKNDVKTETPVGALTTSLAKKLSVTLPDNVGNGIVKVRVYVADNVSVNGGIITSDGTANINNIVIKGQKIDGTGSTEETPSATGIESLTVGESHTGDLVGGTVLNLQCGSLAVSYEVSVDGADYVALDGNTYTIPDFAAGEHTIKFRAKKDDKYSQELSVTVSVAATEPVVTEKTASLVSELTDGSYVLIYSASGNTVLTGNVSGKKLSGCAATIAEDEKLTVSDEMEVLKVVKNDKAEYSFVTLDGKYLTSGATGNALSFVEEASEYSLWTVESLTVGEKTGFTVKNTKAEYNGNKQALEYYSGAFTTYGASTSAAYLMNFYAPDYEVTERQPEKTPEEQPVSSSIENGTYVVWAPAYNKAVSSKTNSSSYYIGIDVSGNKTTVAGYDNSCLWDITKNEDGTYSFAQDGKYIGLTSGDKLTVDANPAVKDWTLEVVDDAYRFKANGFYLEWLAKYSDWSVYKTITDETAGAFNFYVTKASKVYDYDSELEVTYATWGGGSHYADDAMSIPGDLFAVGDMKDTNTAYTAVISGKDVKPFQTTTPGTGGTTYYMGGTSIGSGTNDYLQFKLSTQGYAGNTMSFRMRCTKTAPGAWTMQYSTDGENFFDFSKGSYECAYKAYGAGGTSTDVKKSGEIADGKAKIVVAGEYITYTFDVPSGADNAKTLYVRLVPNDKRANGEAGTPAGNVRIDSVKFTGHPIMDDGIAAYIAVDPDGIEEDQAPGTVIGLTSATEGANIAYRFVTEENYENVAWTAYTEEEGCILPSKLPVYLQVKASKEGKQDSIIRTLSYAAGTVGSVKMTPNGGGVYMKEEGDKVQITLACETEGATIYYNAGEEKDGMLVYQVYDPQTSVIELEKGFESFVLRAYAVKEGFNDSPVTTRTFTERSQERYNIYFGQMHAHTSYSDGAGTAKDAFEHASQVKNLDFLALTDHSNSFDNADSGDIAKDASVYSTEWAEGKQLAKAYTTDKFVGLFGYEMTWSNGLGHMNTFNTPGFQSRTQTAYATYGTALQNYYAALKTVDDGISQFNHPGTTFGDFSDFAYYDDEIDQLITLIEVGNGEGEIGSSNYFPSYEYYTRALDKGWHVAPTNNQDNHKGLWGDSNTARSVVLVDTLNEESIYDAMRNYRVYATEDNDLSIYYALDGNIMGTILSKNDVDNTVTLTAHIEDPTDQKIGKVEVIVNGGLSIASMDVEKNAEDVTFTVGANYSYYYLRVTQEDKDIAVTAPVWVGEVEAVGISSFVTETSLPVQGEPVELTTTLYNNEKKPLLVNKIEYSVLNANDEKNVIKTYEGEELEAIGMSKVAKQKEVSSTFAYTYDGLGKTSYYVTVYGTLNEIEKIYTEKLDVSYVSKEMVTNVVVDGSHYNDYVTGYYGGNMTNFTTLAARDAVKVTIAGADKSEANRSLTKEEWEALLSDATLLIVSAPARTSGTANAGAYKATLFEDWFLDLVAEFVENGGNVIVAGLADYQDTKAKSSDYHGATQLNKLLAAIGSSMKINDDEAFDITNNGGQEYRLYPENFAMDSKWLAGVVDKNMNEENYQKYSQYSGCTVSVGNGTALVKGFGTTLSVDSDKDGAGNSDSTLTYTVKDSDGKESEKSYQKVVEEGNAVLLAVEETSKGGNIFAAGNVFVSDFDVKAEVDNAFDLQYANATIAQNILRDVKVELPYTSIAKVREAANAGKNGSVYRVKGRVTSGTANPDNAFFDCIYIQDETAGIDIFPYAQAGLALGTEIEITGYIDSYQGDLELKVMNYKILDDQNLMPVAPTKLACKDAADYENYGGLLIQVEGTVKKDSLYYNSDGTLAQFVVTDETGDTTIFIDGYILSGTTGKNTLADQIKEGYTVSAVGVQYVHPELFDKKMENAEVSVLRVRNCDEIVVTGKPAVETKPATNNPVVNVINNITNAVGNFIGKIGDAIRDIFRRPAKKAAQQVIVEDEPVAQAAGNKGAVVEATEVTEPEMVEIATEETPLAAAEKSGNRALVAVFGGLGALLVLGAGVVYKRRTLIDVE